MNQLNVNITINEFNVFVKKNTTIIQACLILRHKLAASDNGKELEIPRFCFHQELEIAGNCRMCLVELIKSPKPVVACALQVNDNMVIKTDTILVKKAREGVLEFFLINHPLDCPVCDQGGECDLQDQIDVYGIDKSRFNEYKRAIAFKSCSPFIKMVMTRCIHCTRCIRFLIEIAGTFNFCLTGRGNKMEVGTFIAKNLKSELSGNIVDLCPVGALTSKPTAFKLRFWEITKKETIDVLDSMGADIRVDLRGTEIMRILPRLNKFVNNNWITDVTRYSFDALSLQRFTQPYYREDIKYNKNNLLFKTVWTDVLELFWKHIWINKNILKKKINYSFLSGTFSDVFTAYSIKNLSNVLGSSFYESRDEFNKNINMDLRRNYLSTFNQFDYNTNLNNINLLVLVGLNLRFEAPLLNIKIRKLKKNKKFLIISFSNTANLLYYVKQVSITTKQFIKFIEGKHYLSNYLINNLKLNIKFDNAFSFFLLGSSLLRRSDSFAFLNILENYSAYYNKQIKIGVIQTMIGRTTAAEIGLVPGVSYYTNNKSLIRQDANSNFFKNPLNYLFIFAGDDFSYLYKKIKKLNSFNIYIGAQGHELVDNMHLILPTPYYFEKEAMYLNLEGVIRYSQAILKLIEQAQVDWRITFLLILKLIKLDNYFKYINCKNNYLYLNYYFKLKKEIWLNKLNFFTNKINNISNFKIKLKACNSTIIAAFLNNFNILDIFLLLIIKKKIINIYLNKLVLKYYIKLKIKKLNILYLIFNFILYFNIFLNTFNKYLLHLNKNSIIFKCNQYLKYFYFNKYNFYVSNMYSVYKNYTYLKILKILPYIFVTKFKFKKIINKNKKIKFFNISLLRENILTKSIYFFDTTIMFNYIYINYYKYIFSNIFNNFMFYDYKYNDVKLINLNLIKFFILLIFKIYFKNFNLLKYKYIYILILKKIKLLKLNKIIINCYLKEFRYYGIKGLSLYFTNNIEDKLYSNILTYSRIFLNVNQYYLYLSSNNYKYSYILNKKIFSKYYINNYPFISYIDNFYKTTIVSKLSITMNSVIMRNKYKVLFSNYL